MQPSTYGSQAASQEHPMRDTSRDTMRDTMMDTTDTAMRLAHDTAKATSETYSKASNWMQQNYGKTIGVVGALAAAGVIGYFIGKSNHKTEMEV